MPRARPLTREDIVKRRHAWGPVNVPDVFVSHFVPRSLSFVPIFVPRRVGRGNFVSNFVS
jgi:hypothetical protein